MSVTIISSPKGGRAPPGYPAVHNEAYPTGSLTVELFAEAPAVAADVYTRRQDRLFLYSRFRESFSPVNNIYFARLLCNQAGYRRR